MPTITSRQNPLVAKYRAAARGDDGVLLLDGAHLVAEALRAGLAITDAAVTTAARERADIARVVDDLARAHVAVATVSPQVMAAMSPVTSAAGLVALAARPSPAAIDGDGPPLLVIAVDVQDPGNLGAIVRVAEAAGATGVLVAGGSADPFGWKALRGSMGSALRTPIARHSTAPEAVDAAQRRGCRVVATVPRGGRPLYETDLTGPTAVLIGGEGHGLPDALVEGADERITVPMKAPVESLNAAVTAALIVYEARRQRR